MPTNNLNDIIDIQPHSAACISDEHAMDIARFRDALKNEVGRQYLKCRNVAFCYGTAKMPTNNLNDIIDIQPHSAACIPDEHAMDMARFRDALKNEVGRQFFRLRDAYDTIALLYPEGAAQVPYEVNRPSLKNWRRLVFPPVSANMFEFATQLANPENALSKKYVSVLYPGRKTVSEMQECYGTAKMPTNNLNDIIDIQPHSAACISDEHAMDIARFRDALKNEVGRQYPEGAAQVPYEVIRPSLKNWRRLVFPPVPVNMFEFATQLANPENAAILQYVSEMQECYGTAKMPTNNLNDIIDIQPHSAACIPDEHAMDMARFRDALKNEVGRQFFRLRDAYDTIALLYPEGAAQVPYEVIRPSLKNWRRLVFPPVPVNMFEFATQLANPENAAILQYVSGE
ncbi:hypothetical protein TSAR_012453 [Trichomalopsis sarcophagae]|uniref:Uncharacterized protein n=1 Tax=Trichomalopsis sarcophagae TaxID=543379 RepID=A0A232FFK6_9HYME|nr:hypothetical protein TSAR_012453 [Trichomalopsis sarcophagae]